MPSSVQVSVYLLGVYDDWRRLMSVQRWAWYLACHKNAAAAAKSLQSCPTPCDLIDGSPPGSAVPGILQARTLEWAAIPFSSAWKWKVKVKSLSCVRLPATPWTAAHQAPLAVGFSRQESWSGLPLPSPAIRILQHYYVETSSSHSSSFPFFPQTPLIAIWSGGMNSQGPVFLPDMMASRD